MKCKEKATLQNLKNEKKKKKKKRSRLVLVSHEISRSLLGTRIFVSFKYEVLSMRKYCCCFSPVFLSGIPYELKRALMQRDLVSAGTLSTSSIKPISEVNLNEVYLSEIDWNAPVKGI